MPEIMNGTANISVSIIIVSFNTKDLLKSCIDSIYETSNDINHEFIIVDNASTDGSPEMIKKEFRDITLIRNTENIGFARANNQALRIARGEYFLLLNSDTIVKKDAIKVLVNFMSTHERAAAVGPKVLNIDGTVQSKGFSFPSIAGTLLILFRVNRILPESIRNRLFGKYFWNEHDAREVDWISGCCLLIRKSAMCRIGLLEEDFFFLGRISNGVIGPMRPAFSYIIVPMLQ